MKPLTISIKILCHTCDGEGYVYEIEYETRKRIQVKCPECNGDKWVFMEGIR